MKYCTACGAPLKENAKFCPKCGALIKAKPIETGDKEAAETIPASETAAEKIEMPAREETVHSLPAEKNGHPYSRPDLMHYKVFLISVSFIVILAIVIGTLFSRGTMPSIRYSYLDEEKKPQITYEIIDTIWPSLYKQSDFIVNFTGTCSGGDTTVMVKAEVPGFSQVYEQQYTLGRPDHGSIYQAADADRRSRSEFRKRLTDRLLHYRSRYWQSTCQGNESNQDRERI